MRKIYILFLLIAIITTVAVFSIYSSFTMLNDDNLTVSIYSDGDKTVHFILMHHIGTVPYYNTVQQEIIRLKELDHVLFYEYIDFSESDQKTMQQSRKMFGFIPDEAGYANMADMSNLTVQNQTMFLNLVNDLDFNIDYTPEEILALYEEEFGSIILDDNDLNTPIDMPITNTLSIENVDYIMVDMRDELIIQSIIDSPHDKIILQYGLSHEAGVFDGLVKQNPKWEKIGLRLVSNSTQ